MAWRIRWRTPYLAADVAQPRRMPSAIPIVSIPPVVTRYGAMLYWSSARQLSSSWGLSIAAPDEMSTPVGTGWRGVNGRPAGKVGVGGLGSL